MKHEQGAPLIDRLIELLAEPEVSREEALIQHVVKKFRDAQTRHPGLSVILHTVSASLKGRGHAEGLTVLKIPLVLEDCEGLDAAAETNGLWTGYCVRFLASMHDPRAAEAVRQIVSFCGERRPDANCAAPTIDELFSKVVISLIRSRLRDGEKPGDLLNSASEMIAEKAGEGDTRFFMALGEALKEHRTQPLTRGIEALIRRAWLPLALWQCSAMEREKRLSAWWEVLTAQGVAMPKFPSPKSLDAALRRVRAAFKAGRR